jgi:hypothetical protein
MILNLILLPRGVWTSTVSPFCAADGRLVRELVLGRIGLGRADDVVLDGLLGVDVAQPHDGADRNDARVDVARVDHARGEQALLELGDLVLEHRLLVLRVVVLGVLGDVAELARNADALGDLAALVGSQQLELLRQLLVALGGEEHFLQDTASRGLQRALARFSGVTTVVKGSCHHHPRANRIRLP